MARIVFITGTDTGVGKTLLTAMLLWHNRGQGIRTLAIKPFCSGSRADAELMAHIQGSDLAIHEINPYYFPEPLAPGVAARKHRRNVPLDEVLNHIHAVAKRCECLIIEGCGGLLVPLGKEYLVGDLIAQLHCRVIVVAPNKLGVINHTILTLEALRRRAECNAKVVLMGQAVADVSAASNVRVIRELLVSTPVIPLKFLKRNALIFKILRSNCKKTKKTLARILA